MIPSIGSPSVTVATRTPGLEHDAYEIVVTIPTFRRPAQLLETLVSVRRQRTTRRFAIIVIENDAETRAGAAAAAPLFESGEMEGLVIVAHERGNCSAYNAGWETALLQFPLFTRLLVIDDDEIADPDWLERLCQASEQYGADIVGGPQLPIFEPSANAAWQKHPVFAPSHRASGRVSELFSSGNLSIGRNVLSRMGPPFLDLQFNFMGGGDSDFLSRSAAAGFMLAWCAEAIVRETVPARRLEADWIRARSLRNGVISTLVEKKKRSTDPLGRLRVVAKSLALLAISPFRALPHIAGSGSLTIGLYPVYVALGRVLAEFGYANEQYRQPDKN